MPEQYTASRIHEVLCLADGLNPSEESALLNRIRYLAKSELLHNSHKVDKRGTLAFPPLEVYRAAIFSELAGLAMDVRALEPITLAAERRLPLGGEVPPSVRVDSRWRSAGGLRDSIRGVAAGEQWWLTIEYRHRGYSSEVGLVAEFVWEGAHDPSVTCTADRILGMKPVRTSATINLSALFGGIIPIVGVPE